MARVNPQINSEARFHITDDDVFYGPIREYTNGHKTWLLKRNDDRWWFKGKWSFSYASISHLMNSSLDFRDFVFHSTETYSGL